MDIKIDPSLGNDLMLGLGLSQIIGFGGVCYYLPPTLIHLSRMVHAVAMRQITLIMLDRENYYEHRYSMFHEFEDRYYGSLKWEKNLLEAWTDFDRNCRFLMIYFLALIPLVGMHLYRIGSNKMQPGECGPVRISLDEVKRKIEQLEKSDEEISLSGSWDDDESLDFDRSDSEEEQHVPLLRDDSLRELGVRERDPLY